MDIKKIYNVKRPHTMFKQKLLSPALWTGFKREIFTWLFISVASGLMQPITDTNPETPFGIVKLLQVLFMLPVGILTAIFYTLAQNIYNPDRSVSKSLIFMFTIWVVCGFFVNALIHTSGFKI